MEDILQKSESKVGSDFGHPISHSHTDSRWPLVRIIGSIISENTNLKLVSYKKSQISTLVDKR